MPPKQIFKGQVFCISGKQSKTRQYYEDCIQKYGGTVVASVTASVTYLVSNEDDVKALSQKVATAQGRNIPIVKEDFLDACVGEKALLAPGRYVVKGSKRKAAAKGAPKARPAKKAKVESGPVVTTDKVAVIPKSGLAEEAAVVIEEVTKSFGKASITWDVELVLNDPEKGKDKFYNMQLLASKAGKKFWCVQHWGRTGMEGAVHVDGPMDSIEDSKRAFKKKYRQKTGNPWGQVDATFVESPSKYKLLAKEEKGEAQGRWQYYMHNRVDGKKIGWYDYDGDAAKNMEKYWRQYNSNEGLGVRFVQSDYFKYEVNFTDMIQTNTKSGTRRVIRRVKAGEKPSPDAPEKIPEAVAPRAAPAEESESEDEPADEDEDEDEGDEAAEGEAAAAEEEAEKPAEAAGGGRKPPPKAAEEEEEEAPAAGGRAPPPAAGGRAAPAAAEEAEEAEEAEAPAAGGRAPPPAAEEAEEAEEAEAPAAGGRKPPPDAGDAETEAGSPAGAAGDDDETMAATLPLGDMKRRG